MADREILVLNESTGAIEAIQSGDVGTFADIDKHKHYQVGSVNTPPSNPMLLAILGMFPVALADDATEESFHISIHVPDDRKAGTDMSIHLHYMNVSVQTGTNTVRSGIEYVAVATDEDGTPATTVVEGDDALANNEAAEIWHEAPALVIPSADIAVGDVIGIRVYRAAAHANDTATGDIAYDGIHVKYISDRIG